MTAQNPKREPLPAVTLVLGGARSGKSLFAEGIVAQAGEGLYIATAEARDAEMAERIRRHRERRGSIWMTIEEPIHVVDALARQCDPKRPALVDCLTMWLSNLMGAGLAIDAETGALRRQLKVTAMPVVLVSNEVGLGLVPQTSLERAFRDHAGRLNQSIAAVADRVIFVAAGLPLVLKD